METVATAARIAILVSVSRFLMDPAGAGMATTARAEPVKNARPTLSLLTTATVFIVTMVASNAPPSITTDVHVTEYCRL